MGKFEIVKCENCDSDVKKRLSHTKRYKHFFCNKKCQTLFLKRSGSATEEKCSNCNCDIKRTNNQKRNSKTGLYFCGNQCKNKYIATNRRWKGSPRKHRCRKEELFNKANYICQKCGYNEDKRMLDVHHFDENHQNNEWSNLRCVCVWCHNMHHRGVENIGNLPILIDTKTDGV